MALAKKFQLNTNYLNTLLIKKLSSPFTIIELNQFSGRDPSETDDSECIPNKQNILWYFIFICNVHSEVFNKLHTLQNANYVGDINYAHLHQSGQLF